MKPEIMLVGTFNMAMHPNVINNQQDAIQTVVQSLNKYHPTKIAVEKSFLIQKELDRKYKEYLNGRLVPTYDEVEQLAFPIAKELGLSGVYPIDEIVDMSSPSLNQVFEWAKEYQPGLFREILTIQSRLKKMEKGNRVQDILRYVNDPLYIQELKKIYMKLTRVGNQQHQVGVNWLKQWYHRDLAIAANISRIAEQEDRILVLIGGDHLHLLEQFILDSDDFHIQSVQPYL
ncbi:DUF5694 domain-containing protein [Halobacillus litoralis]|uniref:DUF5694 domain-containing protein n=1 Tax=Halobacillus litoralis TaxID=45668 RepID=UPI001CFE3597|nr:DUF5694 domain-containing protein [Halobacillus litoralis]